MAGRDCDLSRDQTTATKAPTPKQSTARLMTHPTMGSAVTTTTAR